MRDIVKNSWMAWNRDREGFTPFMYCDTLNLVTTGVGNLIDGGPRNSTVVNEKFMAPAMGLPWKHKAAGWTPNNPLTDGVLASQAEIADAWTKTKLAGMSQQGGFAYKNLTPLSLDVDGLTKLVMGKLASNDAQLAKTYPGYNTWPADAQVAINSMSWAMGAAFFPVLGFAAFKAAADKADFRAMAAAGQFKGGGSITDPKSRNFATNALFNNAADVIANGADPDKIYFPGKVPLSPAGVASGVASNVGTSVSSATKVAAGAAGAGAIAYGVWKFIEYWRK